MDIVIILVNRPIVLVQKRQLRHLTTVHRLFHVAVLPFIVHDNPIHTVGSEFLLGDTRGHEEVQREILQ